MADINWGILQAPQSPGIQSSMGSAPGSSAPAPVSGMQAAGQIQDLASKQQAMGLLKQEGDRAQALQPGLLQAQADAHAKAAADQAAAQYATQVRQKTSQAFMEGQAKGGIEGGLDAQQQKMMEMGDSVGALAQAKTREEIKKSIAENGKDGIAQLGAAIAGIVSGAKPATPPQQGPNGQSIPGNPGVTSLQLYAQQYPTLKKLYPDAPDPSTFKDDGQFHDAFTVPVLATAGPIAEQKKMDMEAQKNDDLHKANVEAASAQRDLTESIKVNGPDSQITKDAAETLQNAQDAAQRIAVGKNWVTSTVAAPFRAVKETLGLGGNRTSETIKKYSPESTTSKSTEAPAFSASEIQAELARRAGSK